jgi:hypothetical protein
VPLGVHFDARFRQLSARSQFCNFWIINEENAKCNYLAISLYESDVF